MDSTPAPRCGRISYTNDLPVYAAFDAGALAFPGTLDAGVPADLNRKLLAGELDISPVSSFFYAQHAQELALLPFVCIGAHGPVRSVVVVSERHPRDLAGVRIALTRESATGRALFDVICRKWYAFAPHYVESAEPFADYRTDRTPCLLIGDAAIDATLNVPGRHAFDVGALWREHTGLGMIYAVWAATNEYVDQNAAGVERVMTALRDSLQWSETHMSQVIAAAQAMCPRPSGFYEGYYRTLDFHFSDGGADSDDDMRRGMKALFGLAVELGLLDREALKAQSARVIHA